MKFKNIKKKAKKIKSPSNSRTISSSEDKPESIKLSFPKISLVKLLKLYRGALKFFVAFIFIVAVVVVGLDLRGNLQTKREIDSQREVLSRDLKFWEDFISKNQGYRDAYFQASILEYRLGNTSKARMYVEKGLSLDPNSEDGLKIEKLLNK